MSNKEARLLRYLTEFGSITSMEAISELGDTRLSATIFNLREKGISIVGNWEEHKNRWGEKVRFIRYTLTAEPPKEFHSKCLI